MTGQDIVLVLGAYTALVLGAFGMLIKFAVDSRRTGNDTNRAVNPGREKDEKDAPTTRELVEELHSDVRELRREGNTRHGQNVAHLNALDRRMRTVETDLKSHMRDVATGGQ